MVRGLNKVQVIGNLGADPELRTTATGGAVTNFRVAVSRNRRGTDGNPVDDTEWFRVVAFDAGGYQLAEICHQFLRKGQTVYVEGRLQSRKYTDKDGLERTSVEIVANEMIMLGGRGDEGPHGEGTGGPQRVATGTGAARGTPPGGDDFEDDVPF